MERNQIVAEALYEIGALKVSPKEPYQWSSGILSPVYCDNRLVMSHIDVRKMIADELADLITSTYPDVEVIAGCATAGIPHAAWVAERLQVPMVYVRDKAKGHGKQNRIEGRVESGQKAVVIEDLISTGGSSIQVANSLRDEGVQVLGVTAIFTYGLSKAEQAFSAEGLKHDTLTNFIELLNFMENNGHISLEEVHQLKSWCEDPQTFSLTYQFK